MSKPRTVTRRLDLLRFLKQAHAFPYHYSHSHDLPPVLPSSLSIAPVRSPVYVLGNPSADLDSIISAIIYSYFATRAVPAGPSTIASSPGRQGNDMVLRQHIPLINLPDVHAGQELKRLRPEFFTALGLAVGWDGSRATGDGSLAKRGTDEVEALEGSVLTVADLKERLLLSALGSPGDACRRNENEASDRRGYNEAASRRTSHAADEQTNLDVMMVDWNTLPKLPLNGGKGGIEGISDALPGLVISVVGCIDHHDNESFVPREPASHPHDPYCIQTGVGSCMSLVVRELRAQGLWADNVSFSDPFAALDEETPADETAIYEAQAAKLAMAAILIDTVNMTAKSKVSAVDTASVAFLEAKIQAGVDAHLRSKSQSSAAGASWDRQSFYEAIALAKENSVENLTVLEALGRDYKEWTEIIATKTEPPGINNTKTVKLGICSIVKPLSWLMEKCDRESKGVAPNDTLLEYLSSFAAEKNLDLVVVMTAFRMPEPKAVFRRELLLYALNRKCLNGVERFHAVAVGELGLEEGIWTGHFTYPVFGDRDGSYLRVWRQIDVSKSRKQVAPLLRETLRGVGD
ncbi:exopolyphosphatase [Histoplasma ohiense]|nr:exopolyphosphatase [Histoplasma ohiense (nom. inval.)]